MCCNFCKSRCHQSASAIYKDLQDNIDVLSPQNLSMRDSNCAEGPRHAVKSDFFKTLNSLFPIRTARKGCIPETQVPQAFLSEPFYVDGAPPISRPPSLHGCKLARTICAIDLSNVMHYPVLDDFRGMIEFHAKYLCRTATRYALNMADTKNVTVLELHVDDPELVPRQKRNVQQQRDESLTSGSSANLSEQFSCPN